MKYFAQTLFSGSSLSSANASLTSDQFDISEVTTLWLAHSASAASSTSDLSIQLQLSNDALSILSGDSVWINEGSAGTFNTSNVFRKHSGLGALKARVVVTRNAGTATLTTKYVGKPLSSLQTGDVVLGGNLSIGGDIVAGQFAGGGGAIQAGAIYYANGNTQLSGTTQIAYYALFTSSSSATAATKGYISDIATATASYTSSVVNAYDGGITAGAGSTITHAVVFSSARGITATGTITNRAHFADNHAFSGAWGINMASTSPNRLNGGLGTDSNLDTASSGNLTAQSVNAGFRHYSHASAKTLCGLVAPSPAHAQIMVVTNTGGDMTVANDSGTETTAANRIITSTGADRVFAGDSGVILVYVPSASRWYVLGAAA